MSGGSVVVVNGMRRHVEVMVVLVITKIMMEE